MSKVLVTTGATVTFKELVAVFTKPEIIRKLIELGVNQIVVQYGNETKNGENLSTPIFEQLLRQNRLVETLELTKKDGHTYVSSQLTYVGIPFVANIEQYISQADVVVSHAGTGSIVDVLRARKKLAVVVNSQLMDNHQVEVAEQFVRLGHCVRTTPETLVRDIEGLLRGTSELKPFGEHKQTFLQSVVYEEANKTR